MHPRPSLATGKGCEYDKVHGAPFNKKLWHAVSSRIRVDESPDKGVEFGAGKVVGDYENPGVYEQVAPLITIPNHWLPLRKAPA